ncbi:MMPL family transporter [Christiangramia salexigens]|uniref:Membrane transport protein MMPL domain-containing protein n=1 Tax=Christiangramia salexigens TaxID=1913577 RepID=A0A1L3J319_9FLAO|nr:MMPL family transporter [Christiangramia salexigens]APG59514.1 hypothetical protein LPB144_03410 [Christiangramia salexigens]
MNRYFLNIYNFLNKRKSLGLIMLLAYLMGLGFIASRIQFEEDITKLIPAGEKQKVYKKILQNTDFSDKLIISVSSDSTNIQPDSLVAYAEELDLVLRNELAPYIESIQGKVPDSNISGIYNFVYDNLPIFLNSEDYTAINHKLPQDSIRSNLASGYRRLLSPTGLVTKNYFFKDPLNITGLGLEKLRELQVGDNFSIYKNYLITKDQQNVVFFLDPKYPSSETNKNAIFIDELRSHINLLNGKYTGVEAKYFGGVLYSLANAERIKIDIKLTIGIAVIILLGLLIIFYRKIYVPLLIFLPSILGGITAIAFLSIFKGSISAISLGIGAILLGISLDYGLHILTHYRNNRNVDQLYRDVCKPVLMSSFTTATAFLCLIFVRSEALLELGIFASVSVIFSSIFALILIPLFYNPGNEIEKRKTFLDKIASRDFSRSRVLRIGITIFFIISLFLFNRVEFNKDLSELNYQPSKLKSVEHKVEAITGREGKNIYMVAYGNSLDDALQHNNTLYKELQLYKNSEKIKSFSSIGGVILSTAEQDARIEEWNSFWEPGRADTLKNRLIDISGEFGFRPESFGAFYAQLNKDFQNIFLADYSSAGSLYLDDFISESENFSTVTSTVSLDEAKADSFLDNFEDQKGIIALDRKAMNQSLLGGLKDDFSDLIAISLLAVFIILLISYRNIEISLLTLLPVGISWVCTLSLMVIFHIDFNVLNIIISTFIFGLGLDYSIFITNASLKEYETGESDLSTYQTSILLSVITTLLGMGVLIFAKHPALKSVSIVSILGVLTAVFISFVIQRSLFKLVLLNSAKEGKEVFSIHRLIDKVRNKDASETEQLYHKKAILHNYRYKSIYPEINRHFRTYREKYLQVSRHLNNNESIVIINAEYGLLSHFIAAKFPVSNIYALEESELKFRILRGSVKSRSKSISVYNSLDEIVTGDVFIIFGSYKKESRLKELIRKRAKKVILLDSDFPERWLLDLNFEIAYRQNNILVLRKVD